LRIFTVMAHSDEFAVFAGREEHDFVESARAAYQAAIDQAVSSVSERVPTTGELLSGNPVDALGSLDDRDIDLLICGSRGYGPLRRVLLGGISAKLVRRAASPVMVVPRASG